MRDAVARAQRRAAQVSFEVDVEPTVIVNSPDRVSRAVTNVIDNARKWSPPEGTIEVRLRGGTLTVRDHDRFQGAGHRRTYSTASTGPSRRDGCPAPASDWRSSSRRRGARRVRAGGQRAGRRRGRDGFVRTVDQERSRSRAGRPVAPLDSTGAPAPARGSAPLNSLTPFVWRPDRWRLELALSVPRHESSDDTDSHSFDARTRSARPADAGQS